MKKQLFLALITVASITVFTSCGKKLGYATVISENPKLSLGEKQDSMMLFDEDRFVEMQMENGDILNVILVNNRDTTSIVGKRYKVTKANGKLYANLFENSEQ